MTHTECIWQFHDKHDEIKETFENFRHDTNEAIRLGMLHNITSTKKFQELAYPELRREGHYATHTQEAIKAGTSLLKSWRTVLRKAARKAKPKNRKNQSVKKPKKITRPYVRKELLKINNQNYKIIDGFIEIPMMLGNHVRIRLAPYVLEKIQGKKLGGITLTKDRLIVPYSETVEQTVPDGWLGMDLNLDNITTYDNQCNVKVTGMAKVRHVRTKCREKVGHLTRNDHRIRKEIAGKYGKKEKDRTAPLMHAAANEIISRNPGIVMEDLTDMKEGWKKGGKASRKTRTKLNSWGYHILQFMVEYKARRLGLPTKKVSAAGTSSRCAECGGGEDKLRSVPDGQVQTLPRVHRQGQECR